jgi:oligopeptide transport system substrate-binding protein
VKLPGAKVRVGWPHLLSAALVAALGVLAIITGLVAFVVLNPTTTATVHEVLAKDQTLSFPIAQDVTDFDPAQISTPADVDVLRNVFSGLYKFDSQLKEVPDLAVGVPSVSADGLTYTFRLRHDARFSNGDPITADDFIYSWNRAAAKQGEYADLFQVVAGYSQVAQGRATTLSGLAKVDAYTFTSTLTKPSGYWFTEVGLWPFWVVDSKVIASAGEDVWFTKPDTLIGSGPFRLVARAAGQTLDFAPVAAWFGGKTGAITHVHVDVVSDPEVQIASYEKGVYSLIGYARQGLSPAAAVRYTTDPKLKVQLTLTPAALTVWIGFNLKSGPFAGVDTGRTGRYAFSAAIDRKALSNAICNQDTSCVAATGGLISKGLQGYMGDAADFNTRFDPIAAKAKYKAWDPDGSKVKGLTYTYDTNPFNKAVCENLIAQWQANLGVAVSCVEMDRKTFFDERDGKCAYPAFRQSWSADYDHPQDWFDYLFVSGASSNGACYSQPNFDQLIAGADSKPLRESLVDYKTASQTLIDDSIAGALVYGVQQYLVHAYVKGAGGNALYDFSWTDARILKH